MTATRLQILAFKARYKDLWDEYVGYVRDDVAHERRAEVFYLLLYRLENHGLSRDFVIVQEARADCD